MLPTVLIVDDEAPLAAAIETYLSRQGLTAHGFDSAERALAALAELAPDIALLDVRDLPLEALDQLRQVDLARRQLEPAIDRSRLADVRSRQHPLA